LLSEQLAKQGAICLDERRQDRLDLGRRDPGIAVELIRDRSAGKIRRDAASATRRFIAWTGIVLAPRRIAFRSSPIALPSRVFADGVAGNGASSSGRSNVTLVGFGSRIARSDMAGVSPTARTVA
jgi:hypothetical protein